MNSPDWEFRKDRADLSLSAVSDFDGDGRQDRAELLVNDGAGKFGLFVRLANGGSMLLAEEPLNYLSSMGIGIAALGSHPTWCGKLNANRRARGKTEKPCDVRAIELKADGIDFFTFESAGRTFYWTGDSFVSEWMSD